MNYVYEVTGTYGSNKTECTVLVCEDGDSAKWYCVEDSVTVNRTFDDIEEGVDVEGLEDIDCFTWSSPIESLDELDNAVNY